MKSIAARCAVAVLLAVLSVLAGGAPAGGSARLATSDGWDISYPQCGVAPPGDGGTGVVGATAGRPFSTNYCLAAQFEWASRKAQPPHLYMNTSNPENHSAYWTLRAGTGPRACAGPNLDDPANLDCAYNFGWNNARDAVAGARELIGGAAFTHAWWLDVETANSWNGTPEANAQDVQGTLDFLGSLHVPATGIYSTGYQWAEITGGYHPPPGAAAAGNWVAGATTRKQARAWCSADHAFSGGTVRMVQWVNGDFDANEVC